MQWFMILHDSVGDVRDLESCRTPRRGGTTADKLPLGFGNPSLLRADLKQVNKDVDIVEHVEKTLSTPAVLLYSLAIIFGKKYFRM